MAKKFNSKNLNYPQFGHQLNICRSLKVSTLVCRQKGKRPNDKAKD